MIQKICILAFGIFSAFAAQAQICVSDTTLKAPGYKPDSLPAAQVGVMYSQSITVRPIRDTTTVIGGNTFNVTIDSVRVKNVIGMPAGFSYQCLNPNCTFISAQNSCVLLSGTANQAGIYPIKIAVLGYARISGSIKVQQPDTITRFSIVVTGTSGVAVLDNPHILRAFPNPATDQLQVTGMGRELPAFSDMKGMAIVLPQIGDSGANDENRVLSYDLQALSPGLYLIKTSAGALRFLKH